jgi:PKD repeat protein
VRAEPRGRMRRRLLLAALLALCWAPAAQAAGPALSIQATPVEGAAPLHVTFAATGDPASYRWDFGDGSAADGATVDHIYQDAGKYTAVVTATAADGSVSQASAEITAYSLSLRAPHRVRYGHAVTFRGVLQPAEPGLQIVLRAGERGIGSALTRANGAFRLRPRIYRPGLYQASFMDVRSAATDLRVLPMLHARFVGTPLVGSRLAVVARLRPAAAGAIRVRVFRGARKVYDGRARGVARVRLPTGSPYRYTVRIETLAAAGFGRVARSLQALVSMPNLGPGSRGPSVRTLESRLAELHYAIEGADGYFGLDTYYAVVAFQKLHGLDRTGRAGRAVWRALQSASVPIPRYRTGSHFEVDKGRQVLFDVIGGQVARVINASTGATGNTPPGVWHVYDKEPGYNAKLMYYSMFFVGGFAIHGYADVPPYPASHGCVRIPLWIAPLLYATHSYGTTVIIY